jgi:hypothetical protein
LSPRLLAILAFGSEFAIALTILALALSERAQ